MQSTAENQDIAYMRSGDGYELTVRKPGAYQFVAPQDRHFLDIQIGGAKGHYSIEDLDALDDDSPSNSFVFLPANGERRIDAIRSGWSIQLIVQAERFDAIVDTLPSVDLLGIRLICHAHDDSLVGIANVLKDVVTTSNDNTPSEYYDALVTAILVRTAYHFSGSAFHEPRQVSMQPRIQIVLDHVENYMDRPLPLSELAELANTSPYHFSRMFRRATSRSVHQYIIERRLERAKILLADSDASIAQISYDCGFGSQSHMTNVFTKILGTTPGAFRKVTG